MKYRAKVLVDMVTLTVPDYNSDYAKGGVYDCTDKAGDDWDNMDDGNTAGWSVVEAVGIPMGQLKWLKVEVEDVSL